MSASATSAPETLRIDVWMDFCCPACYLAKPRLAEAVQAEGGSDGLTVVHHSYQLLPEASTKAVDSFSYVLEAAGADEAVAERQEEEMAAQARAQGQGYLAHRPSANSFDAHRFLHLAAGHGKGDAFFDRAQRDLFANGIDIYGTDYLIEAVTRLGVPEDEAQQAATSDAYADAVRADERAGREVGITGVPFTVVGGALAVPGAAAVDYYRAVIRRAQDERR